MRFLELLAPAKNIDIGIAAIDCGADAVYIAGPAFGARQAAGNSVEDIRTLCSYAHRFGARVFITLNTIVYDSELEEVYSLMLKVQEAGADAIIVQDLALLRLACGGPAGNGPKVTIPLHASTQCAIRDKDKAILYRDAGFSRLVLEREMTLDSIREISSAAGTEIEFFVHGALCVCYSGQCYMSEALTGRSANRGECVQACRSLYDLVDESGKILVRKKALLSLKDYNLLKRVGDLALAGVTSFKIEGRLKNISYVRNVVRAYSQALDAFIASAPDRFRRASHGIVQGGFTPDPGKTFNRGYTELYLDGRRGRWASIDAPKGMGEPIGKVQSVRRTGRDTLELRLDLNKAGTASPLRNGDGFAFIGKDSSITGFRGDVCRGNVIICQQVSGLQAGMTLYRNISTAFEKSMDSGKCQRLIPVNVDISISYKSSKGYVMDCCAISQDNRTVVGTFACGTEEASNQERMEALFRSQIGKSAGMYLFSVRDISRETLPFVSPAFLNEARRTLAGLLDGLPCNMTPLANSRFTERTIHSPAAEMIDGQSLDYRFNISNRLAEEVYREFGAKSCERAYEIAHQSGAELMRTRYCIRYELGMCPVHQTKGKRTGALFLLNNGRRFALHFDCANCEMGITAD
ncbi:MAG: DUF3656 domain-containing protein [Candidatus Cryptobacteroides sp.]